MKKINSQLIIALALTSLLLISLHIAATSSSSSWITPNVTRAPLGVSNYLEDFTDSSLEDTISSTAHGWGTGAVTNQRQLLISQLDFYSTPTKIVDVAVQGRKIYATALNSTGFWNSIYCFNITDPTSIEYMSHRDSRDLLLTGDVQGDIYYNGGAYGGGWIGIYNVSNPYGLGLGAFITAYTVEAPVTDVEAQGHFLYATAFNSSIAQDLVVLDVEDPYNPVRISVGSGLTKALGIDVEGEYAYVANGPLGVFVVPIAQPYAIPGFMSFVSTPGNATDILVDGDFAYVAAGSAGVHIIDVHDPFNPTILGSINTNGYARRLALQDSTLFVADSANGVVIVDVTMPQLPVLVAEIALPFTWDVDLYGGILVIGTDSGVYTYRTGLGLTSLPVISSVVAGFAYKDVVVQGNIAYVAGGPFGLFVFDVKDPANPILLNHTSLPGPVDFRRLALDGNILHVAEATWMLVYNVTAPSYPILMNSWGGNAFDVDVVSGVAYVATGPVAGVQIYNVSNLLAPSPISSILGIGNVTTLQVQGPHLYVGLDLGIMGFGFQVYDITTISTPLLTDQFSLTSLFTDIFVDGDVVYTADTNWPVVWNVTDPFSITYDMFAGWLYGSQVIGVTCFGPYMLSTNGSYGLALIDARNINNITYIDSAPSVINGRRVTVYGDYAFVATNDSFDIVHLFRSAAGTYQTGTARAESLNIATTTELIVNATLNFSAYGPTGTSISFALSADGGLHWETVTPGVKHTFAHPGTDLRWHANLTTNRVDASIHLFEVTIDYEHTPILPFMPPDWIIYVIVAVIIIIIVVIVIYLLLRRRKSGKQ